MPKTIRWRWIKGFKGYYQVSNTGKVRSVRRTITDIKSTNGVPKVRVMKGRVLKTNKTKYGYLTVVLSKNGRLFRSFVHRLVLKTFVGPCPPGMECRHFPDRDKTNNNLSNISWATRLVNAGDRKFHGTVPNSKGEKHNLCKLTEKRVLSIRSAFDSGKSTIRELAEIHRTTPSNIYRVVHRISWKHLP